MPDFLVSPLILHRSSSVLRTAFCRCLFLWLFSLPCFLSAQDIHFSQFDVNPVLFNPAYTGFFEGTARVGAAYRNQWSSVSNPFQTFALTGELSLWRGRYRRSGLSAGCMLFRDKAGSLDYGTTAASLMLSYYFSLDDRCPHFLSLGASLGYNQAGFSVENILLDDPAEAFSRQLSRYPTVALGAAWYFAPVDELQLRAGVSASNLNRPDISYLQLDKAYLERRWDFYSRVEYRCWHSVSLSPIVVVQCQGRNSEVLYGTDVKWYVDESSDRYITLSAGTLFRHGDALAFTLGAEINALLFAFSYDANVSKLVPASNTLGAFELGVVYRFARQQRAKHRSLPCPIM